MITTYQIRIYPTEDQINHLNKQFGCNRFIWNKLLEYSQKYYQETKQRADQNLLRIQLMFLKKNILGYMKSMPNPYNI